MVTQHINFIDLGLDLSVDLPNLMIMSDFVNVNRYT
jgi:hypothetical protein